MKNSIYVFCPILVLAGACKSTPAQTFSNGEPVPFYFNRPTTAPWSECSFDPFAISNETLANLPSRVNNAETPYWHGIRDQGQINCCAQEGAIANVFGYEYRMAHGLTEQTPKNSFPSHFSYNILNDGVNDGTEMLFGLEVATQIGVINEAAYGSPTAPVVGYWPNGYDAWHNAMHHRADKIGALKVTDEESLNQARAWLYNHADQVEQPHGGMFTIDGKNAVNLRPYNIPEGVYGEGHAIWAHWGDEPYGHIMTVVGYDDEIGYDVNGDGEITNNVDLNGDGKITLVDHERGAFLIANSWGEEWGTDGYTYLLYRALIEDPTWDRGPWLGYVIPEVNYQPRLTLELAASSNNRNTLGVDLMIKDGWNEIEWRPIVHHGRAGTHALGGPGTDFKSFEWGLDITPLFGEGEEGQALMERTLNGDADLSITFSAHNPDGLAGMQYAIFHHLVLREWDAEGNLVREHACLDHDLIVTEDVFPDVELFFPKD